MHATYSIDTPEQAAAPLAIDDDLQLVIADQARLLLRIDGTAVAAILNRAEVRSVVLSPPPRVEELGLQLDWLNSLPVGACPCSGYVVREVLSDPMLATLALSSGTRSLAIELHMDSGESVVMVPVEYLAWVELLEDREDGRDLARRDASESVPLADLVDALS